MGKIETANESSLQWRYAENSYVLPQVISHPILGIGFGARYRSFDPRLDFDLSEVDLRSYIHNAHFWIVMKAGPLGYLCFMWLSIMFLFRGFKYFRLITDCKMRGYVLGFTLTYLGALIGAILNPIFLQWYWTPLIGIMMGLQ